MRIFSTRRVILAITVLTCVLSFGAVNKTTAQKRRSVFQSGEELVYKVKFGFIKLGTLVIQTGSPTDQFGPNQLSARMQFWTADVPFLDTKTQVIDVIDTHAVYLVRFEEHTRNGDKKTNKVFVFDHEKKTMTYSDDAVASRVTNNVEPFNDALTLVFNMRTWSASGAAYSFPLRGSEGEKNVTCRFTGKHSDEECPAFEDQTIKTRIVEGQAEMGNSAPLGANGHFTAYLTDDEAAVPVRIDMQIGIGSISLILEKVKRPGWKP